MTSEPQRYMAYLLRLWHVVNGDGRMVWLASLEDPHTGERRGFGSVQQLLAFLQEATDVRADRQDDAEARPG